MTQTAADGAANSDPLIDIAGLTKRFGERLVLDQVSLAVRAGQTVAVLGPSGGGKSTLLRCINGLSDWDAGQVRVGPYLLDPRAGDIARRVRPVRQLVGMVFQDYQLFPHLTALENIIEAPVYVRGQKPREAQDQGRRLLERVGLADRADAYPEQLSGGQQQRVAIARALAMQPQGLLCDEITSALDPELKHEVLSVLEDLKRDGLTLVMVTHEIGFARRAADRIVILADGRILEDGPPEQVLDAPNTERARQFLARQLG